MLRGNLKKMECEGSYLSVGNGYVSCPFFLVFEASRKKKRKKEKGKKRKEKRICSLVYAER